MANTNGFLTKTLTQTGTGSTGPVVIFAPGQAGTLQPAIGVAITGTATVTVEWSGDNPNDYATANWFPFTGLTSITATSAATIGAAMTMIRCTVNSGSGVATLQVCQQAAQGA